MKHWLVFAALLLSCAAGAEAAPSYTVTDLGDLYDGFGYTFAADINATGQVTGYTLVGDAQHAEQHAFLYSNGVMTDLGTLGGTVSYGYGINGQGTVAGVAYLDSSAFRVTYNDGTNHALGTSIGIAQAINDAGQITGTYLFDASRPGTAFLYEGGALVDLGVLGTHADGYRYSTGYDINASGQIVGESTNATTWTAFLYSNGVMTDLGTLAGLGGYAAGINDLGQIVGNSTVSDGQHATLWENGAIIDLGTLGGTVSRADGINNLGAIVGISGLAGNDAHAFLYQDGQMLDLSELAGFTGNDYLLEAVAINDAGQIVANGFVDGQSRAFLLTPSVPEPASWALMIGGMALVGGTLRTRPVRRGLPV